ncbi:DUF1302 family protein [Azoarcus indigens]|uniref:Uncharacterized protein DUF1302 n=1 Tax=Azoarcus indigens TaxID=29545 RepID=A0A4R6EF15_9RHOO|nr:DUF1302 domain-containing protein [Azoarcus indigens]NMG67065.1 DUF1302 family protein [Azoarcus indigens]TDN56089.1 uncharacterized protein DUF1302 [Azoarcus indigens]
MTIRFKQLAVALALAGLGTPAAQAFQFENEFFSGSLDSTLTVGFGQRVEDQRCNHIGDVSTSCGGNANTAVWGNGDDGNLNYDKGDFFTAHIKGSHELLLNLPDQWKFMGRVGWLHDFAADDTARTDLRASASNEVGNYVRLYDFWVSKEFDIAGQRARARLGNQVVSWGESLFMFGGINSNVAMDMQRLSSPGVQLKEAYLPAPMFSLASSLGNGINAEAYYQFEWKPYSFPPAGTYFSVSDTFGAGRDRLMYFTADAASRIRTPGDSLYGMSLAAAREAMLAAGEAIPVANDDKPRSGGQYGVSLKFRVDALDADVGLYYQRYHDKTPNVLLWSAGMGHTGYYYEENRELYGISANTSLGNWAVGAELSYRPKDAVSLGACVNVDGSGIAAGAECRGSVDEERYQLHLTGILSLTPSEHGWFLDAVGAQTGTFLGEVVGISYPNVHSGKIYTRSNNGVTYQQQVAAGNWTYLDGAGNSVGVGDSFSWGYMFDFSVTYDGSLIPGWQVIPGVAVSHAVRGNTPNFMQNWMEGAKSANFYVLFNRNPSTWQAGINYTKFWGGDTPTSSLNEDRDFIGGFLSRNF